MLYLDAFMPVGRHIECGTVDETKGYDNQVGIPSKERSKIDSAKEFFKALQDLSAFKNRGVRVKYQTKINGQSLAQLIVNMAKK